MKMSEARKRAKKQEEQAQEVEALSEAVVEAKAEVEIEAEPEVEIDAKAESEPEPAIRSTQPFDRAQDRHAIRRRKYALPDLRVVVFKMADHEYVVDVAQMQEIIRPTELMQMDGVPEYVEGLVKRRGRIVPILDLRKRLNRRVNPPTPETCVLIAKLPIGPVGFLVDSASELMWVKTRDFEVPSQVIAGVDQAYIQGVAHLGDRLLVMLSLELLLTPGEQEELAESRVFRS